MFVLSNSKNKIENSSISTREISVVYGSFCDRSEFYGIPDKCDRVDSFSHMLPFLFSHFYIYVLTLFSTVDYDKFKNYRIDASVGEGSLL